MRLDHDFFYVQCSNDRKVTKSRLLIGAVKENKIEEKEDEEMGASYACPRCLYMLVVYLQLKRRDNYTIFFTDCQSSLLDFNASSVLPF